MCIIGVNRYKAHKTKISMSDRCLKNIKRGPFDEKSHGKISDENECIICMAAYENSDTITQLNCSGKHFFHTVCIENWI